MDVSSNHLALGPLLKFDVLKGFVHQKYQWYATMSLAKNERIKDVMDLIFLLRGL